MRELFFFIGTEAELIKIFPVIIECRKKGNLCHIIASGQNDISNSVIISNTDCGRVELELSKELDIKKSTHGLLKWWIKTYISATKKIKEAFENSDFMNSYMIVHGDTVSTYMGARLGRRLGMTVCHVEAGLRSHHLFNPFPEEIDRMLTSNIARIHFAPGLEATSNLKEKKGKVVNTDFNTLLDSLRLSKSIDACAEIKEILCKRKPYFVFVIHRQENVFNEKLVREATKNINEIAESINAIVILHKITKNAFIRFNVLEKLEQNESITLLDRVDYFSFMKLLDNAEFVITDGGSNQEELYYMGKPTLILRKRTERTEGLGKNAVLYRDVDDMLTFSKEYIKFIHSFECDKTPSELIAAELSKSLGYDG